jgi:hypothetical protein
VDAIEHAALATELRRYVQVRVFDMSSMRVNTPLEDVTAAEAAKFNADPSFYSDQVRMLLLLHFGGVWFDLDVMWLRPIDSLLLHHGDEVIVYRWQEQDHPNGAVMEFAAAFTAIRSICAIRACAWEGIWISRSAAGGQRAARPADDPVCVVRCRLAQGPTYGAATIWRGRLQ